MRYSSQNTALFVREDKSGTIHRLQPVSRKYALILPHMKSYQVICTHTRSYALNPGSYALTPGPYACTPGPMHSHQIPMHSHQVLCTQPRSLCTHTRPYALTPDMHSHQVLCTHTRSYALTQVICTHTRSYAAESHGTEFLCKTIHANQVNFAGKIQDIFQIVCSDIRRTEDFTLRR